MVYKTSGHQIFLPYSTYLMDYCRFIPPNFLKSPTPNSFQNFQNPLTSPYLDKNRGCLLWETYSEPCHTSKTACFAKIIKGRKQKARSLMLVRVLSTPLINFLRKFFVKRFFSCWLGLGTLCYSVIQTSVYLLIH